MENREVSLWPGARILPFCGVVPKFGSGVFVAHGGVIIGDVYLGDHANIWFNTVIRGDVHSIRIGPRTNIQDNTTVHVTASSSRSPKGSTLIGSDVTIGHNCVIHACTIEDFALIGMGSTILDGAVVESEAFIAAGSVVTPGKVMPAQMMCMGSPAKPVRALTSEELAFLRKSAADYVVTANRYKSQ